MTSEAYELQVLLELRQGEREQAEAVFAEAVAGLERVRQRVREAQRVWESREAKRRQGAQDFDARARQKGLALGELQTMDRYLEGLRYQCSEAQEELARVQEEERVAQRQVHAAQRAMQGAISALKAVESHHETWQDEQKTRARRRAEMQMDEIATRLWREQQP
ncbi:hypothetical protein DL240_01510 [Lujinxingia litoralis]|uniref:Flagellar FliJ protein n=1 Tax=Lujinxingia litoralis TaxID=2211119 RepID=A0A328CDT9_9DELT|nr:hypothetical protein [Lujinxingia litoralis]RAL24913.1 hypothetical protein DL240_01510 [Lujinxingia litoralis]